ncbi:MAG: ferritin-like fold-containing protein, partial [Gordonia sp. (in: high G+C Gram-positive bacteria)]|uniref:ferritin-like fold-containing protein n=1 Tax=Gordonia sp. (in: high G+C Gram-positive bacteria) TaxID=84139 RepID=UPI0039E3875D
MPNTPDAVTAPATATLYEIFLAGEYSAVRRLIDDAEMAPTIADRIAMMRMVASEQQHFDLLAQQVEQAGGSVTDAVEKHQRVFDEYHRVTTPSDWLEVLVKMYVGDGLAADFYDEMVEQLPPEAHDVMAQALSQTTSSDWVRDEVRAAVAADPALASPLTLWGRRLLGEAITHAQWVLAEDEHMTDLLFS